MKKVILILGTIAFTIGINSCKKKDTTTTPTIVAPVASYTYSPSTVIVGNSVQFTDNSTNNPTTWAWDFGDGGIPGTTKSVAHTYGVSGTYNVTLSVTNSAGSNTITKQVVVGTYAQSLVGTYKVTGTFSYQGTTYNIPQYTCHITQGSSNDVVNFDYFGGWGTSTVSSNSIVSSPFTISNINSLGVNSFTHSIYAASCVVNGNTITITYGDNSNGNNVAYYISNYSISPPSAVVITDTYVKQ
ncbi:MAG: hypothetical protein RI955_221 [Bacteroidota bacterium]